MKFCAIHIWLGTIGLIVFFQIFGKASQQNLRDIQTRSDQRDQEISQRLSGEKKEEFDRQSLYISTIQWKLIGAIPAEYLFFSVAVGILGSVSGFFLWRGARFLDKRAQASQGPL